MLFNTFKDNIIKYELIRQGDRVVAGVSGGADSVCLLLCLNNLRKEMPFELQVLHVNHMIRGAEAKEDAAFTGQLCESLGIPFIQKDIDVPAFATAQGLSMEEAGRMVRYDALREAAGDGIIAVAHNRGDAEETIFHNIIRGSSLAGLSGMKMKDGQIIRPLLNISREEIEAYLKNAGQTYRTDSTNLENDYTRNKLRNIVIPYIEREINTGFGEHLRGLSREASMADDFISDAAIRFLEEHSSADEGRIIIEVAPLLGLFEIVRKKTVYLALAEISGSRRDIGRAHVAAVLRLASKTGNGAADLPYGISAKKTYDRLILSKNPDEQPSENGESLIIKLNAALPSAPVFQYDGERMIFPRKEYTKWFDYDKIKHGLRWRRRAEKDVIELGSVGTKSVRRYFIDEKIPQEMRGRLPLLADGSDIIWIPGFRISEKYKIDENTKTVIEINIEGVLQ
ncbi:MAG: tRNA lysidine(34) synthetase TilS [Lachnospiraceae bacterium]|nr:tRNA lysidine(34) synthetase TilS [Lachnospiraceae bacterium]